MLEVILGSFGAFQIFDKLVSHKWPVLERNEVKFGPQGEYSAYVYRVLLTLKCLRLFWGHSVQF